MATTWFRNKTHGLSRTPAYVSWKTMLYRCYKPKNASYKHYGGRGILVCGRWRESFENFVEDMGQPLKGYQLDRIDNKGDYEPSNCRWTTPKINSNNKRTNKFINYKDVVYTLAQLAEKLCLSKQVLSKRLKSGKDIDTPLMLCRSHRRCI